MTVRHYRGGAPGLALLVTLPLSLLFLAAMLASESSLWWFLICLGSLPSWGLYRRVGVSVDDHGLELRGLFGTERFEFEEGLEIYVPGRTSKVSQFLKIRRAGESYKMCVWFAKPLFRGTLAEDFERDVAARSPNVRVTRRPPPLL